MLAAVVIASGIALLLVNAWTGRPASDARVRGFAARHLLRPDAAGSDDLRRYLTRTRRYRSFGVVIAAIACAVSGAPSGHVTFGFDVLLCGWLAGAWLAETKLAGTEPADTEPADTEPAGMERPQPGSDAAPAPVVPRWVIALPYVTGAVAVLAGAVMATIERAHVIEWTVLSLLVLAGVARAVAGIGRRAPIAADPAVDRATRSRSTAALTAVGTVIVIGFMLRALAVAAGRTTADLVDARNGLDLLWTVGAITLGLIIARIGSWAVRHDSAGIERPAAQLTVVATVLVVATGGWLAAAWVHDHPPYSAAVVHPAAVIKLTDTDHVIADARAYGGAGLTPVVVGGEGDRLLVGRVDFAVPTGAAGSGRYDFILIDTRTNQPVQAFSGRDGGGWGGSLGVELPRRYPWLSAVAPHRTASNEWTDTAQAVQVDPAAGYAAFTAAVPDGTGVTVADLMLAMVFVGTDGQIYWAAQVPVSAAA